MTTLQQQDFKTALSLTPEHKKVSVNWATKHVLLTKDECKEIVFSDKNN